MNAKLAPSLMCADIINLQPELDLFISRGVEFLHVDVMDGHYVPNFSLGPGFCKRIADYSPIPLDVHLMIENVDAYLNAFVVTQGTWLSFHPEVVYHPMRTIEAIRARGGVPGIAIDPATTIDSIRYLLPIVSFVCVMTVNPGYTGQALIPQMIDKIAELAEYLEREKLAVEIEVDGNVSWRNIPAMVQSGASILVLGTSSLYDGKKLDTNIDRLRSM